MDKELNCMLERFPEAREKIHELFGKSEDFRLLCEDYWYIQENLQKYRAQVLDDKQVENEFNALCASLEHEVLRLLRAHRHF